MPTKIPGGCDEPLFRFGSCQRNADKLMGSVVPWKRCAAQFLAAHRQDADWTPDDAALAPRLTTNQREHLAAEGVQAQSLTGLTAGL